MNLRELSGKEFSDFANMYPLKSIYQTAEYTFAMSNQGYSGLFLGLFDNYKLIAATSLMIKVEHGFKYAYAPRGFLLNFDDSYLLKAFVEEIKSYFKEKVYDTIIPRLVRLSEAPSHGKPIHAYDPKSRGTEAYLNLAKEVIERNGN